MHQEVIRTMAKDFTYDYTTYTHFYLKKTEAYELASTKKIETLVADHQPSVDKLNSLFKKINDKETNDYRAIIEVITLYNNK